MSARYVGIDPGRAGAAVVIGDDGESVLDVEQWSRAAVPPVLSVVRSGDVVALEDQYIGDGARAAKVLHEWTVRLLVSMPDGVHVLRPLASTWRSKVFRAGRMSRAVAKRHAIAAVTPHLHGYDVTPDLAEAWCMARYAWGWAVAHPGEVGRG